MEKSLDQQIVVLSEQALTEALDDATILADSDTDWEIEHIVQRYSDKMAAQSRTGGSTGCH